MKGSRNKSRVVSAVRKSAVVGAAATALIAATPSFGADAGEAKALPAAIRSILRTTNEVSWRGDIVTKGEAPTLSAVSVGNAEDIVVGPDEVAITHAQSVEDISLINTGNLTGGIGIDVSSGAISLADAVFDQSSDPAYMGWDYAFLYDDAGNRQVYGPYDWYVSVPMTRITTQNRATILNSDPLESRIAIDNRGSIAFSGLRGIKASNPAGESITIANSGDITSTSDLANRVGIYAVTEAYEARFSRTLTPGEFTYNAYGQLTGVVSQNEDVRVGHGIDMELDGGVINIHNTGDIDMGLAQGYAGYGVMGSVGIHTRGDGGTTIVNEGNIKVGDYSAGILTFSTGTTSITNAGRIEVGNASAGVFFEASQGSADFYRLGGYGLGGDVYILNTGDIVGGEVTAATPPGEQTDVRGITVFSQGTNNSALGNLAELNQLITSYNEMLGEEAFTPYDIPNVRLYTTTVVNQGRIELADGARGIHIQAEVGDSIAINEGTILLGEGTANFLGNNPDPAAGIYNSNLPIDGRGLVVSINTETGVIRTGNNGVGLASYSYDGDSVTINDGIISSGDGIVERQTVYNYSEQSYLTYDKLFLSHGTLARSVDYYVGTTAYSRNTGSIAVGELAVGSGVVGNGFSILDPARITALNVNEGIIETGDNSAGMFTHGTNATSINTGTVTSGDYDISNFLPNEATGYRFAIARNGVGSTGAMYSEVINYGTITTGDGKVGASAEMTYDWGYAARIIQNGDGVITAGDRSIGARVTGDDLALLANEGRITVGDSSVGVDITAGNALLYLGETQPTVTHGAMQVSNAGIIESGDNSIGIRMNGARRNVAWSGYLLEYRSNPYGGYYVYVPVSGTADITGSSYMQNIGAIRVGADSTAVEITGSPGSEQGGLHLFNAGTIDASHGSSTAIRVNADNRLGSSIVNVGTIAGHVTFGRGDDTFKNTLILDNAGRVTSAGNIVMNGSTIDFGAGLNRFENERGTITIAGGDNLIAGADVFMSRGTIEARNDLVDSSLTIDGNLSGDFVFGADFNSDGSDQLIVTGDVAEGSVMSVVLNPTEQLKGESSFAVITVDGENNANTVISGITGEFADSVLSSDVSYSEQTGEIAVTARFGLGHMGTSAASATTLAQHWWMQAVGSLDRRDMQHIIGAEDSGVSVWAGVFQEEGAVDPFNDLQDVSFDQKLSGMQTGIEWKADIGGGTFSFGPMYSYGNASASQNANLANASGDASAYGLNAGYRFGNGLYLNASWQQMAMEIEFRTPGTWSQAVGETDAEGDGFNVELGYAHQLKSGLTLAPQLQYASTTTDLDDFTSSDGVYTLSELGGKYSLLRAGLSVFKTFETKSGSITPLVDVSYLDAMDGESTLLSNGIAFGNDASGSGYRGEFGIAARYKGWDITARVGLSDTTTTQSALSSNLSVRYRW